MSRPIRDLLVDALRTDPELDAFCLDYFRKVYDRFSAGMDRVSKVNLLLSLADHEEILHRLGEWTQRHLPRANGAVSKQRHAEHIKRVTYILAGAQDPNKPVSQVLVECLALAHESKHSELESFCRGELEGWSLRSESEIISKGLTYRLVDIYLCVRNFEIDLDVAHSRFCSEDALFQYFQTDNDFKYLRFFLDMPVFALERRNTKQQTLGVLSTFRFKIEANRFLKNSGSSNFKFTAYARSNAVSNLLESIRQRLIKNLLELLRIDS
jgi:hypothetical protein